MKEVVVAIHFFKIYYEYSKGYTSSVRHIETLTKTNTKFANFFKELRA